MSDIVVIGSFVADNVVTVKEFPKEGQTVQALSPLFKVYYIRRNLSNIHIILVDDIYTKGVFVAEDCAQSLLDFGAKRVILYVIAKTRDEK